MTREELKLIWLMSYLKMESLQVVRGGPHMRTGIFEEALKKSEMSPVAPQAGDHVCSAVAVPHPCDAGSDPCRTRGMPDVSRSGC